MPFRDAFAANAISGSGMSAERYRMEVIANNIANAQTTKSANGGPFRRQDVVFAEMVGTSGGRSDCPAWRVSKWSVWSKILPSCRASTCPAIRMRTRKVT